MKIVIVVETFARDMGYINNTLPKYLARQGHDVHVITTDLPPYFQIGSASKNFGEDFAIRNKNIVNSKEFIDGYYLYTLKNKFKLGYPFHIGLIENIKKIKPEIVCIFQAAGWLPIRMAIASPAIGAKLVIGSHMGKTVFPLSTNPNPPFIKRFRNLLLRKIPGLLISSRSHHCVVPTKDCAEVAEKFFGISRKKIIIQNLPVDTDYFYPNKSREDYLIRKELRNKLGIAENELLCLYSGKFTKEKNAIVLPQAIEILRDEGLAVRALLIGNGEQAAQISTFDGVLVKPFMPISELGNYYRAADLGVWMNESISFLDAACSGLPLIISDTVKDITHIKEFTINFETNNPLSLAFAIKKYLDPKMRQEVSKKASQLGFERFGGARYACLRSRYYQSSINDESLPLIN